MEQIDWSKAPEGATHVAVVSITRVCWYKIDGGFGYSYSYQDEGCDARYWSSGAGEPSHKPLIERPAAWSGTGLPPVGTVCEITTNDGYNWRPVKIIFSDDYVVMTGETAGAVNRELFKRCDADVYFRPIRTPEQIAAEQREKAVQEMVNECPYPGSATTAIDCLALYKAGYRKFEIVPE
jgi:hypothetical protein